MPDVPFPRSSSLADAARSVFGPLPGVREIRLACWTALLASVVLVALSVVYAALHQRFLGHPPGGDFVAFYGAGKILNEYPPARVYDEFLQFRLQHSASPEMPGERSEVYINPPFLGWLFRPLARLPFLWAYGLWMAFSAALYLGGMALLWPQQKSFAGVSRIAFLSCCSFFPFTIECMAGGQISAVGFFALALCTRWRRAGYPLAAGAALALCLYKPTLLVLVGPMLLIGRRFRMLAGFAASACVLGALSLAAVGYDGCIAWLHALRLEAELTARNPSPLPLFKFVDIHSFFRLLLRGHWRADEGIALVLTVAAFVYLALRWARSRPGTQADGLLWAATIAWTLVFNLYIPIYDTILIVISALLMADAVYAPLPDRAEPDRTAFLRWMLALFVTAGISEALAVLVGFQPLTLVLAGVGALALRLSRNADRLRSQAAPPNP